jgi:hypothetical protein
MNCKKSNSVQIATHQEKHLAQKDSGNILQVNIAATYADLRGQSGAMEKKFQNLFQMNTKERYKN